MPPFLHLVPLPKSLTTDLPKPLAAGIGLAVSLPGLAVKSALALPATVLGTSARILGRYEELAEIGAAVVAARGSDRDDVDEFDAYPDIQGWGEVTPLVDEPADLAQAAEDRLEEPATTPDRRSLAIDDYDSLSASELRAKVGALSVAELEAVRDYEQGHAKRLTVLQLLERTIAKKS